MVKEIIKDEAFLAIPSEKATEEDKETVKDLVDTFEANRENCVGLAANMIGVSKRIIVVDYNGKTLVMLNPVIIKREVPYKAEEGCLSLEGTRETKRFNSIKVMYETQDFKKLIKSYTGFTAEVIQHEVDHCNGIVI